MKNKYIIATKLLFIRLFKWLFVILGVFSFVLIILSFTSLPYHAYHWLGTSNSKLMRSSDVIVLLGGSGMPSPDGLIRTYYAAEAAAEYKEAELIIAHPYQETDSLYQLKLMARELILKGVDSSRIKFAPFGYNTHSQAENVAQLLANKKKTTSLLLITSPEHMYRSIASFKKVGFTYVGGIAAFEVPISEEKVKDKEHTSDLRVKNLSLRYNMWSYLNYELIVLREYCAIGYYKVKGWI